MLMDVAFFSLARVCGNTKSYLKMGKGKVLFDLCTALLLVTHRVLIYNHGQQNGKGDSIAFKKIQKVCLTVEYEIISIKCSEYLSHLRSLFFSYAPIDWIVRTGKSWCDSCTPVTGIALSTVPLHSSCIFWFQLAACVTLGFAVRYMKQYLGFF